LIFIIFIILIIKIIKIIKMIRNNEDLISEITIRMSLIINEKSIIGKYTRIFSPLERRCTCGCSDMIYFTVNSEKTIEEIRFNIETFLYSLIHICQQYKILFNKKDDLIQIFYVLAN